MSDSPAIPRDTATPRPVDVRPAPADDAPPPVELVEAELLVEDVSIDGMCGVY
jgi:mycofactocin precursor